MSLQPLVGLSFIILLLFSSSFSWSSLAMVKSGAVSHWEDEFAYP